MPNSENHSPSILIVDDDPLVCHIIRIYLENGGHDNLTVVHDGHEAIAFAMNNSPNLVFLDIGLPDMDGLEVLSVIHATSAQTQIIMLTGLAEVKYVTEAIAYGATGYLVKRVSDLETLNETVNLALEGDALIVDQKLLAEAARKVARTEGDPPAPKDPESDIKQRLTSQEMEVLKLIAGGLTNHEIGESLHISYNTVKTHVSNIYQKLKVSDRTQAAIVALRQGITADE